MGGSNSDIRKVDVARPTRTYTVTFEPMGVTVEVDPGGLPCGDVGRSGSLLSIALAHGVDIEHACGGVCACSTCHVVIRDGFDSLSEITEAEADMLDSAAGVTSTSRLACQAVPDGSCDVVAEIPVWNRNLAKSASEEPEASTDTG